MLAVILLFYYFCSICSTGNFNCINEESSISDSAHDAVTSISCSNPAYTLVSCGHRTLDTTETRYYGSWISGQTCYAKNAATGVYAVARCCDLSAYSISCNTVQGAVSDSADDSQSLAECANPEESVMGCAATGVISNRRSLGLVYPGVNLTKWDNVLTVRQESIDLSQDLNSCNGLNDVNGTGVYSYATCCTSSDAQVAIQCEAVWSSQMYSQDLDIWCSDATQFITACTGVAYGGDANSWFIDDNDKCNIHKWTTHKAYAVAICCSVKAPTESPTQDPTTDPTIQPTVDPTKDPTKQPTITPTTLPTHVPTFNPTLNPTPTGIHCVNQESLVSDNIDGAITSVSCSNPVYSMVSCGHRTVDTTETRYYGSWISGHTCYAKNAATGVYAVARCCNFPSYSISCNTVESTLSDSVDDAQSHIQCEDPEESVMGCGAVGIVSRRRSLGLAYPGVNLTQWSNILTQRQKSIDVPQDLNSCNGFNDVNGSGVYSYATCCKSVNAEVSIQCEAVWSESIYGGDLAVSCSDRMQVITGCSGIALGGDANSWLIDDNDICKIHKWTTHKAYAVAICCSVTAPTESPTKDPTTDPTSQPTKYPTADPTVDPIIDPTSHPTKHPSIPPTTANPTSATWNPTLSMESEESGASTPVPDFGVMVMCGFILLNLKF